MAKRGFTGTIMRATGAIDHLITVRGKELISPGFLRIYLHSDTLFDEAEIVPTAWLRFWFPDPDGENKEHQRAYTIVAGDEQTGEFACDFVLNEPAGPASAWAVNAQPGDTVEAITLGSTKFAVHDELTAGYLLIGDTASIPGINSIIDVIPDDVHIELYLETQHDTDVQIPLSEHPLLSTHWVPRTGPESLAASIEPRDWSNWYAWVVPESKSLKHLRTRLRDEFGFPKSEMYVQAYWVEGRAMGKLRDEPQKSQTVEQPSAPSSAEAPTPAVVVSEPAAQHQDTAEELADSTTSPRGSWRAAAGGRLIANLKPLFIAAGILQGIVTLLELSPYV